MSNQNESETAAEFVATVRTEHVAMKEWYRKQPRSLTEQFGPYPDLWKHALNWSGWKEVRKLYLKDQQQPDDTTSRRKRKSRWGTASSEDKKSRWSSMSNNNNLSQPPRPSAAPLPLPGLGRLNPDQQRKLSQLQQELRRVNDQLENVHIRAAQVDALPRGHRDRSPSPPPVYGPDGKRQNTRSVRWKTKYTNQRQDIMQKLLRLTGSTDVIKSKKVVKVPIPIDEYPNYNFIGLIIGPRGKTQKELEAKTGCKIAIRGRGSVKEGARKLSNDQQEPLHVVISGDDPRAVDAAEVMIKDMLVVLDDEQNVHKQNQLRELAVLNGTLKQQDEYCANCGQKGHRAFECPRMLNNRQTQIRCSVCGETSHPTRDCPQARTGATPAAATEDKDYQSFMAEINGERPPPPPATNLPPPPQGHLPPPPVNLPPAPTSQVPPQQQPQYQHHQQGPPPPHHQQQQQSYYSNYPPHQQGQQQAPPPPGGYQQPPQVQPGQEANAWDPNAYYGSGGGAGFNWWES